MDEFVVMPNHVHGIVWIVEKDNPSADGSDHNVGVTGRSPLQQRQQSSPKPGPPPKSLGSFVAGFKSACTKRINIARGTPGERVWQRNYYERVIRDEGELNRMREYILTNPLKWELDKENPGRRKDDRPDPKNTRMIQTFCLD